MIILAAGVIWCLSASLNMSILEQIRVGVGLFFFVFLVPLIL